MPLFKGKSKAAFSHNVGAEMDAGKPQRQALAIAYSMKRKKKGMGGECYSSGGDTEVPPTPIAGSGRKQYAHGGKASPYSKEEQRHGVTEGPAQGRMGYAKGGMHNSPYVKGEHYAHGGVAEGYQSECTEHCEMPCAIHEQASGFESETAPMEHETHQGLTDSGYQSEAHEEDMIGRIMRKRMSEGGRIANETDAIAGSAPNEFDDLVLRDGLEQHDTAANSGDEDDDSQENKDREDMIERIMRSRRKRAGHNPTPA